jgi:hypothetical protein
LTYSYLSNLEAVGPFVAVPSLTSSLMLHKAEYDGASIEYTRGPWTFASEYQLFHGDTQIALPAALQIPVTTNKFTFRNYYVSIARRLGTQFEVGTYYTATENGYPVTGPLAPSNRRRDWALAVRYDFNEHLLFKLEGHAIDGTKEMFNVPGISNTNASLKDSMMLFVAKTTLSF